MKKKTVRFGIIGTGLIASTHAEALKRLGNAVLFMVYDRDLQKAEAFARRFECRFARTFEELLESSVEAVTIATPSGLHAQSAIPAARAGKHIFCEKPLDVSIEKAEEMIRACDKNKVRLAAVYPLRFCDSVKWVRNMLDAGRFGTPVLAGGSIRWYRTPEYYASAAWRGTRALDGGGVLMNQGIHIADLLLHLNGDVSEVSAYTAKCLHRIEVIRSPSLCASATDRSVIWRQALPAHRETRNAWNCPAHVAPSCWKMTRSRAAVLIRKRK